MGLEPIADNCALRSLEYLSTNAKDHSADEHHPKDILETSKTKDKLSQHAEHAGNDEDNPGTNSVDERASSQRDDNIGEWIECVEEIELGLSEWLVSFVLVVFLDVLFQSLDEKSLTLGLSKAY